MLCKTVASVSNSTTFKLAASTFDKENSSFIGKNIVESSVETLISTASALVKDEKLSFDKVATNFISNLVANSIFNSIGITKNTSVENDVLEDKSKLDEVFKGADNYKLSDDVFENHILDRHGPESLFKNKSQFNSNFDIKEGIDSTLKGDNFLVKPNTNSREGYIFEQTFKDPIGVDSKGKPINTLKVVIDECGNVVTAFPKK